MFTRKAIAYFLLSSLFLILALVLQDWQIATLVLPLASLFFLTNATGFPEKITVKLDMKISPSESFGDEDIRVTAIVENKTDSQLENIEVQENLPPQIEPKHGTNHFYTSLPARETLEFSLEFQNPGRGQYRIGPLTVTARDTFGLYLSEKQLEPQTLAVMPRPEKTYGTQLRQHPLGPWAGTIPSRASGPGSEFFSLRGYVPGDDLKKVNWKASARANRLIVNEMEAERVTDVMVLLDTDVRFFESSERELFEQGVRAAASMSSLLLRQGNRVGLILQGVERGIVLPAFGKRQERRILYTLAAAKPGGSIISTGYIIALLAKLMLPSHAEIIIISPLLDPEITLGINKLVAAGYSVTVLSPSPRDPETFDSEAEKLAFNITRLERSNILLAVDQACTLISLRAGITLSQTLREARKTRRPIRT